MLTIGATELKNRLGEFIDKARREPVLVQIHGRDSVVLLDHAEYERLRSLEDSYWIERAEQAAKNGFMSPEETVTYLQKRLGNYRTEDQEG
jgi:prevent-host-death family protein